MPQQLIFVLVRKCLLKMLFAFFSFGSLIVNKLLRGVGWVGMTKARLSIVIRTTLFGYGRWQRLIYGAYLSYVICLQYHKTWTNYYTVSGITHWQLDLLCNPFGTDLLSGYKKRLKLYLNQRSVCSIFYEIWDEKNTPHEVCVYYRADLSCIQSWRN